MMLRWLLVVGLLVGCSSSSDRPVFPGEVQGHQWTVSTLAQDVLPDVGGTDVFYDWWLGHSDGMGTRGQVVLTQELKDKIDALTVNMNDHWTANPDPDAAWADFYAATVEARRGDCKAYARIVELNLRSWGVDPAAFTYGHGLLGGVPHMVLLLTTDQGDYVFSYGVRYVNPWFRSNIKDFVRTKFGIDPPDGSVLVNGMNYSMVAS